jgi:hypothetical protein
MIAVIGRKNGRMSGGNLVHKSRSLYRDLFPFFLDCTTAKELGATKTRIDNRNRNMPSTTTTQQSTTMDVDDDNPINVRSF